MHTLGFVPHFQGYDQNYHSRCFQLLIFSFLRFTTFLVMLFMFFFHIIIFIILVCFFIQTSMFFYLLGNIFVFFRRCSFLKFTLLTICTVLSFVVNSHKITLLTIFTVLSFVVNPHKKSLFLNAFSNVFRFLVLFTLWNSTREKFVTISRKLLKTLRDLF